METSEVNENILILLEGEFRIEWCSRQQFCMVRITSTAVTCSKLNAKDKSSKTSVEQNTVVFSFQDIIGCRSENGADNKVRLIVFAFPVKKLASKPFKLKVRNKERLVMVFEGFENIKQNQEEAMKWKNMIDSQMIRMSPQMADDGGKTALRRVLVVVNPCSGAGKAPAIFKDKIRPILEQSGIDYKHIQTERVGHGKEIAKTLDLKEWYGLIVVSGDGMMFELVNGLMERDDWQEAIKLPIGLTPGGSGNCLSCSILYSAGESYLTNHINQACYVLSKHVVRPMDVTAVDTCTGERLYACCNVNWGLLCDVDIESERWRLFGSARFAIESVSKIVTFKKYRGKFSFLPVDQWDSTDFSKRNQKRGVKIVGDDSRWRTNAKAIKDDVVPKDEERRENSREENYSAKLLHEQNPDREHEMNSSGVETQDTKCKNNVRETDRCLESQVDRFNGRISGATVGQMPELPKLTDPLPANWLTLEDEFVNVSACLLTHMSDDIMSSPDSKLNDGIIYMFIIRSGATRREVIRIMNAVSTGKHRELEGCEMIPVKAFRLEPITPKGNLAVDGEVVSYGPIQCCAIPGLARVMAI